MRCALPVHAAIRRWAIGASALFVRSSTAAVIMRAKANEEIVALAMIETMPGLENLDAILKVEGLDGIYIGPADLSLSLGLPGRLDPVDVKVVSAIETILTKCKSAGRRCGIHTGSIEYARNMVSKGFDFVTILGDSRILAAAAETIVRGVKASPKQDIASSTY
jgi:4-hydroxy-2-oxoheptanedioate aldolase